MNGVYTLIVLNKELTETTRIRWLSPLCKRVPIGDVRLRSPPAGWSSPAARLRAKGGRALGWRTGRRRQSRARVYVVTEVSGLGP